MKKLKKMHKLVLMSSLAAILAGGVAISSTYALFTSEAETKVIASAGKVNIQSSIESYQTYSGKDITGIVSDDENKIDKTSTNGQFTNGGTAKVDESKHSIILDKMTPGDKVTFIVKIVNYSDVISKYRTIITCNEDDGLYQGLKITTKEGDSQKVWDNGFSVVSTYQTLDPASSVTGTEVKSVEVTIELPTDVNNTYADKKCELSYIVQAIQGNAAVDSYSYSENDLCLFNEHDLRLFADSVNNNSGNISSYNYIKLVSDVTLTSEWTPIGQKAGNTFVGKFDGCNHTISGLYVTSNTVGLDGSDDDDSKRPEGVAYNVNGGYGALFGAISSTNSCNSEVKNLTVNGTVECANAAGIVSRMNGGIISYCTSNVTVTGSTKAGGIVAFTNNQGCSIMFCKNQGKVTGGVNGTGGIVGYVNGTGYLTSIEHSINTAEIGTGNTERYSGGIAGYVSGNQCRILSSINEGNVKGLLQTGGIAGLQAVGSDGAIELDFCLNTGEITSGEIAGGIIGASNSIDKATIDGCTNSGKVTATSTNEEVRAGGVVGSYTGGTIKNCFGGTQDISVDTTYGQKGRLIGHVSTGSNVTLELYNTNNDSYTNISSIGYVMHSVVINVKKGTIYGEIAMSNTACSKIEEYCAKVCLATGTSWIVDSSTTREGNKTWTSKDNSWIESTTN